MSGVVDYAELAPGALASLEGATARLRTLEDVIRWGLAHVPPLMILEVVVQDEYCHDVIVDWVNGNHLVFDTT